jgi:hypothetical protein
VLVEAVDERDEVRLAADPVVQARLGCRHVGSG